MSYVWPSLSLVFLVPLVVKLIQSQDSPGYLSLNLAGIGIFALVWDWSITRGVRWRSSLEFWISLLFLTAMATAFTLESNGSWIGLFLYVGVLAGFQLPANRAPYGIGGVVVVAVLAAWTVQADLSQVGEIVLLIVMMSFSSAFTGALIRTNIQLEEAREEIARLAASEERLRIARDLHDLLGHSLSAIALKTELARRLVPEDPQRAEKEIGDVEAMVRDALKEVRDAVSGYRQPMLADELQRAREILSAAGIAYVIEGDPGKVPPTTETAIAWAVREGITNVIRHSRAKCCTVRFLADAEAVSVEVVDNGRANVSTARAAEIGHAGSGLRGLAERLALCGGSLEAGQLSAGGFRLRVTVPSHESGGVERSTSDRAVRT